MATIYGTEGNDALIAGTNLSDQIYGYAGNDVLAGYGGADMLDGGSGNDTLYGDSGNDDLYGWTGDDLLDGGNGSDRLFGEDGDDDLYGGDGADTLFGDAGTDYLYGDGGNDALYGGAGSDVIFGDAGTDTVRYLGGRNEYSLGRTGSVWSVRDLVGTDGMDQLNTVERAQFADLGVAFDTGASQSAGQAALLVGAVLGHSALADKKTLIGDVIDLFDQGYTMSDLSGAVMRLDIWGILANGGRPTASTEQIATYLFSTVYGVAPYPSEVADAVYYMNNTPQGAYLAALAVSAANQSQVGLIGLADTGLEFGL
jgi:hypothetical protein